MKSTADTTVKKSSDRIAPMIQHDVSADEEWEQFVKEFSSVHQGFFDRLIAEYGSFPKSETRLIALMKMNLSSKDITSALRISDDGNKKARYRLRKKLSLDSDVDLKTFILSY